MMNVELIESLPVGVRLVAVTKYHSVSDMQMLYAYGLRCFAESRSKELLQKQAAFAAMGVHDIEWHFIGHLQTNKAREVVGVVQTIQSVDSVRLMSVLERLASERDIVQDVLLEMKIAQEENKYGFEEAQLHEVMRNAGQYPHLRICGLMGMATQTEDKAVVQHEFEKLYSVFAQYKSETFKTLSAGISEDYEQALRAGSNMLRIGSLLFQ